MVSFDFEQRVGQCRVRVTTLRRQDMCSKRRLVTNGNREACNGSRDALSVARAVRTAMAKLGNVFRAVCLRRASEPRCEVSTTGETATVFRAVAGDCHSKAWTVAGECWLLATRGVRIAIDGDTANFVVGTVERNTRAL